MWSQENGERVQVALALTCPKVPVATSNIPVAVPSGDWNFEDASTMVSPTATAEITEEERKRVADLMEKLGL